MQQIQDFKFKWKRTRFQIWIQKWPIEGKKERKGCNKNEVKHWLVRNTLTHTMIHVLIQSHTHTQVDIHTHTQTLELLRVRMPASPQCNHMTINSEGRATVLFSIMTHTHFQINGCLLCPRIPSIDPVTNGDQGTLGISVWLIDGLLQRHTHYIESVCEWIYSSMCCVCVCVCVSVVPCGLSIRCLPISFFLYMHSNSFWRPKERKHNKARRVKEMKRGNEGKADYN